MVSHTIRGRPLLRASTGILFLVLGAILPAAGAEAQLRILPQLGLYAPVGDLGEVRSDAGATLLDLGRQSSTLAFGLAGEIGGRTAGLGVRAGIAYATTSTVPVVGPDCPSCAARGNLLVGGAALVLRPIPPLAVVQPYFLLGGGVARYGFDDQNLRDEGWRGVLRTQTRPQLQLGIGTGLEVVGMRPRVELSAHVARYEPGDGTASSEGDGERQTNLFLTFAIPLGR